MKEFFKSKKFCIILKIVLTLLVLCLCFVVSPILLLMLSFGGFWDVTVWSSILILPLVLPLIWLKKRKIYLISFGSYVLCFAILLGTQTGMRIYDRAITIDVAPAINTEEYLPFTENSKIVKIDSKTLSFDGLSKEELPVIDGAAALFPVYSAFVHAVYPETIRLNDGVFEYNNTVDGYIKLYKRKTDLFIGAYPSIDQIIDARSYGIEYEFTQIGSEAFVFFVHKDNPITSLTTEQIKGIYSGEITNWSEVGGNDEEIVPFQRNKGSGSQSMLIRFMGDTPIMPPTTQTAVDGMGGIINEVADYKNKSSSIGFSFRFYVEGIIKNPDIKIIAIDGIAPTVNNIQSKSYPIITPIFAVTYEGHSNKNVDKLIEWMLSEEGQYIIEQTGYVGIQD